jgi:branched-chain amino acid transport system permease protein
VSQDTRGADRLPKGLLRRAAGRVAPPARPGSWLTGGRIARLGVAAVVAVAALLFPQFEGGNIPVMFLAITALTYGLVAIALNLLMGFGGQISIGHGGFLAVGAFTAAIVATHYHFPSILVLLLAGLVTGAVGFLLGLPAGRLRSHYLAVATLGFGVAVPELALNMSLTGGFTGIIMPTQQVGGIQFSSDAPVPLYYLALILVAIGMAAVISLLASPTGRRFRAVRDSEEIAPAMGVNVPLVKLTLFSLSAFFTGLAGYVFALNNGIVEYSQFDFSLSLLFFAAVIVGGLASTWGPLVGAIVLVIVQQQTTSLGGLSETILGAAVVLVLLVVPGGLAALPRLLLRLATWAWRTARRGAHGQAVTSPQDPVPAERAEAASEG